jgi:hypothetical protein
MRGLVGPVEVVEGDHQRTADRLGLEKLGDLAQQPELLSGFVVGTTIAMSRTARRRGAPEH